MVFHDCLPERFGRFFYLKIIHKILDINVYSVYISTMLNIKSNIMKKLIEIVESNEYALLTKDNACLGNITDANLSKDVGNNKVINVFGYVWFKWYTFNSWEELYRKGILKS